MSRDVGFITGRQLLQTVSRSNWFFLPIETLEEQGQHLPCYHMLSQFQRAFPTGVIGGRALRGIARDGDPIQHKTTPSHAPETG